MFLALCRNSCGWSGGLDWVEAHGESERVGLANDAAHGAFGIEPGRNDESVTSPLVQDELAELRARMLGER